MQNIASNLTNGFFPFGGCGSLTEIKRPNSPVSPSLPSVTRHMETHPHSTPSTPWDFHFDKNTNDERMERCTPSPPHQSQPQHQPHGEGLAA